MKRQKSNESLILTLKFVLGQKEFAMKPLSHKARMDLSIDIVWTKDCISHKEHYFAGQINCWRDIVEGSLLENILDCPAGDAIIVKVKPGELVPDFCTGNVLVLPRTRIDVPRPVNHLKPVDQLKTGRFYPQGMISGLPGIFKGNRTPFRCVGINGDNIRVDLNHPMAGYPLSVTITVNGNSLESDERGGGCTDWMDLALSGPGLQARYNNQPTDFFSKNYFDRKNITPDPVFYETDRFVPHMDARARQNLSDLYQSLLLPGDTVLDLMASWDSHIPIALEPITVHGLGLNANELAKNQRLTGYTIQDLNTDTGLYFKDHTFDAVICSLSVEYLIDPVPLFKEAARILKPGSKFAVTFSNRWFPEKAIRIWEELHDFERMGLVTEYFLASGCYETISTISMRGYPRPCEDRYFPEFRLSDPVYAVIGKTGK